MHRNDNSNYFLYIEPPIEEKSIEPINDIYTEAIQWMFDNSKKGVACYSNLNDLGNKFDEDDSWRGIHVNCDNEMSTSRDHLLPNGYITNSLCVHYVRWFRNSITNYNLEKLENIKEYYVWNQGK